MKRTHAFLLVTMVAGLLGGCVEHGRVEPDQGKVIVTSQKSGETDGRRARVVTQLKPLTRDELRK